LHKWHVALIILIALFGAIIFAGILRQTQAAQLTVTKIETMPNRLILDLFNRGPDDVTISQITVNGTALTSKVSYTTWCSNVPVKLPTTIVFDYNWSKGNEYEISLQYSQGQTTILAIM